MKLQDKLTDDSDGSLRPHFNCEISLRQYDIWICCEPYCQAGASYGCESRTSLCCGNKIVIPILDLYIQA